MNNALPEPPLVARMHSLSRLAAISVLCIGGLVTIGWLLNIDPLKNVLPGLATMKVNTALCFILSGVALVRLRVAAPRLSAVFSAAVVLIGFLTLLEYFFGWNLGIDEWLVHVPAIASQVAAPGRMSIISALNFCLIGSSLLFIVRARYVVVLDSLDIRSDYGTFSG